MARLQPEERHAGARLDRDPAHPAGLAVDAGGDVDRDHRPAAARERIDALDDRLRFAVDVARKPRPEQRVDHAIRAARIDRRGVEDRALKARGGEGGIALQRLAPADEPKLDRVAAAHEQARGDEAVAAVPAGAAEDDDPASRLRAPRRLVRDREARPLHERDARRSRFDRGTVGFAHFGWRQELRGGQGIEHERRVLARFARRKRQKRAFHRSQFCYIRGLR